jgi:CheY-like chemotaxis protein
MRLPVGDHAEPGGTVDFNDLAPATLLVVDDNETNRDLMAGMFERTHHRLHYATNGQEALNFLKQGRADLVLLDIRMPVMDGRTALREIRRRPALVSLPVIAVTASSRVGEDQELRNEFNGYVRKPFSRQTLFAALAEFLQRAPPRASPSPSGLEASAIDSPSPAPLPEYAAEWRALWVELSGLEAAAWPGLRASLAINETRAFAHKLFLLGHAAHCDPVTQYAATLTTFADAYAVGDMERHLAQFPKLVKSIQNSVAGTNS